MKRMKQPNFTSSMRRLSILYEWRGEESFTKEKIKKEKERVEKEKVEEKEMVKEHFRMNELDNESRDWMTKYWSSYWIFWGQEIFQRGGIVTTRQGYINNCTLIQLYLFLIIMN